MDVQVMDYISAIKQGDFEKATELSFDCIQCGLCATRCMAEMAQYHIAQMVRRIYGMKVAPKPKHVDEMVGNIKGGRYNDTLAELKTKNVDELKELYKAREGEPHMGEDGWTPQETQYL